MTRNVITVALLAALLPLAERRTRRAAAQRPAYVGRHWAPGAI